MKSFIVLLIVLACVPLAVAGDEKLATLKAEFERAPTLNERIRIGNLMWDYLDGALPKLAQRVFETLADEPSKKRFAQAHADWKNFRMSQTLFISTSHEEGEARRLALIEAHLRITDRYMADLEDYLTESSKLKKPNKAPEPTTMSVTPPAAQESRRP